MIFVVNLNGVAQTVVLDSVNQAMAYALDNNPDLEIYQKNQNKARYDYKAVKEHWIPNITTNFSRVNNLDLPVTVVPGEVFGQPGQTVEAEFGQQYNYTAGLNISKNLLDFESKFTARVAEVNIELSEANEEAYLQKLAEQVALYYYTAMITTEAIEVHEENYIVAEQVLALVEQKFEQGIVDRYTVNLAKINKNNIYQNMNSYRIVLEQCRSNLRILLGLDSRAELVLSEKLGSHHHEFPALAQMNPDKSLEIYKLQSKQLDFKVSQQKAKSYPKVSIGAYLGAQQYSSNAGISLNDDFWYRISYLSINISIPIFTGFSTKNQINSAVIEHEISRNTLAKELSESEIEDELIIKEYNHKREAVITARDNYQIAGENADLQYKKFEKGIVSLDKYLESFDDYLQAEVAYLNLLSDTYHYYAKILSRNV
jgi:outer membrane protein TolC